MQKLMLIVAFVLAGQLSLQAQYGDAYHAPDEQALRSAAAQRQQAATSAHLNNVYSTPTSSASGNGSGTKVYWPSKAERAKSQAESDALRQEAWAYQFKKQQEEQARELQWQRDRALALKLEKKNFTDKIINSLSGSLPETDSRSFAELTYFFKKAGKEFPATDFENAAVALTQFRTDLSSGNFDSLVNLTWQSRIYPEAASQCLTSLYKKISG